MWRAEDLDWQLRMLAGELLVRPELFAVICMLALATALGAGIIREAMEAGREQRDDQPPSGGNGHVARAAGRAAFGALAAAGGYVQLADSRDRPTAQAFADAMAELATGVCVVTASGRDGVPHGMAVTSLCSYSADPPSVLVCVREGGQSHDALLSARAFGVHVLCHDQEYVARRFAQCGGDKFAAADWHWDDDVPALDDVVAYLRCERVAVKGHGDHAIVIGEVERVDTASKEPLLYLRRRMDWRVGA